MGHVLVQLSSVTHKPGLYVLSSFQQAAEICKCYAYAT